MSKDGGKKASNFDVYYRNFLTSSENFISLHKHSKDSTHCAILTNKVKDIRNLHWHWITCSSYVFTLFGNRDILSFREPVVTSTTK